MTTPTTVNYDNGPSGLDRTQIAFVNFIYDIPFLKNSSNKLLKSTVGGWQVSGIVTLTTGRADPYLGRRHHELRPRQQRSRTSCTGSLIGTGNISQHHSQCR